MKKIFFFCFFFLGANWLDKKLHQSIDDYSHLDFKVKFAWFPCGNYCALREESWFNDGIVDAQILGCF